MNYFIQAETVCTIQHDKASQKLIYTIIKHKYAP